VSQAAETKGREARGVAPLFRREAIAARGPGGLPGVIRVHAPYMGWTAALALVITVALVALCTLGKVTQIVSAPGTLTPAKSSLKIFSPRMGVVLRTAVTQGQHVRKGDPLIVVSGEQYGADNAGMLDRASQMIRAHIRGIRDEENFAKLQTDEKVRLLGDEITSSQHEADLLGQSITIAEAAVALDRQILLRKTELHASDIVAITELEKAQELLFSDQSRLLSTMDQRQILRRQIAQYRSDLAQAPTQLAMALSLSEQQVASSEVDLTRNEMSREVVVPAPADGIIATALAFVGQTVTYDQPLMVLDPEGSDLLAQVFVPSRGIGFIAVGARVTLKYDAYPYQTFGYYEGHVVSIGNVALLPSEIQALRVPVDAAEPVFNVLVAIDRQDVDTYGRITPLLAGSAFTANLTGETRPIWKWILNPLLSVKGNALASIGG